MRKERDFCNLEVYEKWDGARVDAVLRNPWQFDESV